MKKKPKEKDPRHVALGKKRWEGIPREEMLAHLSKMGKKGGKAAMEKVRQEARVEVLKSLGMSVK